VQGATRPGGERLDKRRVLRAACVAALLASFAVSAQQTVYRWVDKDGKVHFSDAPPPSDARSSQQKRMGSAADEQPLPYATQVAARRNPVVLYTAASCQRPCVDARELLSRRGIPYGERDASTSKAEQEAIKKLVGALEVPVLKVGDSALKGFEEGQWGAALDAAGYPRTLAPGQRPRPAPTPPAAPTEPPPPAAAVPPPPR
jgi:glutaredoxin